MLRCVAAWDGSKCDSPALYLHRNIRVNSTIIFLRSELSDQKTTDRIGRYRVYKHYQCYGVLLQYVCYNDRSRSHPLFFDPITAKQYYDKIQDDVASFRSEDLRLCSWPLRDATRAMLPSARRVYGWTRSPWALLAARQGRPHRSLVSSSRNRCRGFLRASSDSESSSRSLPSLWLAVGRSGLDMEECSCASCATEFHQVNRSTMQYVHATYFC